MSDNVARLDQAVVTVGTTATALVTGSSAKRQSACILNDHSETLYIGGSNVTANDNANTGGFKIAPGEKFPLDATGTASIYGVFAGATGKVRVLDGVG